MPAAAALGAAVIFRSDHEVAGGADLNGSVVASARTSVRSTELG